MDTVKILFDPSMIGESDHPISVEIYQGDMFERAKESSRKGKRVAIHNFANNERPGLYKMGADGGIYFTTSTQEEQLLRATMKENRLILDDRFYPISSDQNACLITRDATFWKDRKRGYNVRAGDRFTANIISCAAERDPQLINGLYSEKS
jgi:hypothetical protein